MSELDPRIDAYIEKSADFAKPILRRLREVVHAACPEAQETMKWGFPHFDYKGIMCSMAAFKAHCAFSFWHPQAVGADVREGAMGQLGRITSLKGLPPKKVLAGYVRKAMALKDAGEKPTWAKARAAKPSARVRRVDRRGEAAGDPGAARGAGGGVDRRGEAAELEVRSEQVACRR